MGENAIPVNPNQAPAAWSAAAPAYAEMAEAWGRYADQALELVPVGEDDVVLDVAAGAGALALLAAPRAKRVVAVDFSPGMIETLEQRAAERGLANVETAVMDAQSLELEDERFDTAFCLFAYMFFPDRAKAFHELLRVLKPGKRALVATWAPIERRPMMKVLFDAIAEALPQFTVPAKGDLQTKEECEAEMSAAGFRAVRTVAYTGTMWIESPERYLHISTRAAAPFAMMRKKLGEEGWAAAEARLLEALRKRIPDGGMTLSAEALLTVGTR